MPGWAYHRVDTQLMVCIAIVPASHDAESCQDSCVRQTVLDSTLRFLVIAMRCSEAGKVHV